MARSSIVHDYNNPQRGTTPTFTLDERVQHAILQNDIERPKGYTVSYHANKAVEGKHFGPSHPMKPWRLTLTNKIVFAYGMQDAMDLYQSRAATHQELCQFHSEDYIEFLQRTTPHNFQPTPDGEPQPYNIGDDCPIFSGLYEYSSLYAGASLDAARKLTNNQSQIAINWSGGLHHAKKSEASGFCYINDIVLAILQLLIYHPRVLYIDIDVHHGDGVEQAFWSTDRVMTLSFHKYDKESYFPGTGPLDSTGPSHPSNPGAHHSLNVPLNDGIEDHQYTQLYQDIVGPCIEIYKPTAIVLQCGADSLGGDRLGCFNLGIRAHGECVKYTKSFNIPLLVLGGGGYTPANVARCWAYETSVCIGAEVHDRLPAHMPFLDHFGVSKTLFPPLGEFKKYENRCTKGYLNTLVVGIKEQLRYIQGSPSVQLQNIPPGLGAIRDEIDEQLREEREERERDDESRRRKERGRGARGELYV